MGNGKKGKAKAGRDNSGQNNGPTSKKEPIWKQPYKEFVPTVPNKTDTWTWSTLPSAIIGITGAQQPQVSQASVNSAKTASGHRTQQSIFLSGPGPSTFVLMYYINNSVPANEESFWEPRPLPSRKGGIKTDTPELNRSLWTTVPENAKWLTLPSWVKKSSCINVSTWCTKKTAMKLFNRSHSWAAVSTTAKFPTPPKQKNPNGAVASSGSWGPPEPVVKKDPNAPNPWVNMKVTPLEPEEKFPTLVNWPFTGDNDRLKKLVSLGLFVENYTVKVFKKPKNDQKQSALIRALQVEGVNYILLKLIWEHHSTASALSRASQRSWDVLMGVADIWDVSGGNYQRCDIPREETEFSIGVAPVVVVTPTRDQEPIKYIDQVKNLHKMCLSMHSFCEFMQNVQFHHIPFLTKHVLALVIPPLRKLRTLGVYNCPLIHLGDGLEILDIIQRDRPRGCENQVSLDFYPAYHVGPHSTYQVGPKKGQKKVGQSHAFGVSWDDTGMWVDGDVRIAIWQEVSGLIQQARSQGIDFESKHTMFRQWLDKSPCLAVEATLKILVNPRSTLENVIAHVAYGEFGGRVDKFLRSKPGQVPNKPEGSQWMKEGFRCKDCNVVHFGLYFSYGMIRNFKMDNQDRPTCMACKLIEYLDMESDHYKIEKRTIIKHWCWDYSLTNEDPRVIGDWNTQNLPRFLRAFRRTQGQRVKRLARLLDSIRESEERYRQIFHETDEVQRPINHQALGRRGHYGIRAPTVDEKKAIESGRLQREWDYFRTDRINGHGQPSTFRSW
ncbi:hypothetical protein SBOR_1469 [Sclerotinia borealis F-4128]|uniref:Uncharacterized protein n=1 Tax=Sclerotinia borealis (strain F-4128) TaxID=1432307 RepID=W9CU96_SCLBF|nr:hypothetical protein SBOR_1469 [Sclerotinia borealis F-4128]